MGTVALVCVSADWLIARCSSCRSSGTRQSAASSQLSSDLLSAWLRVSICPALTDAFMPDRNSSILTFIFENLFSPENGRNNNVLKTVQ